MCISQLCHLFFWGLLYVNLGRCYKGLNITAVPQRLSRSNVCRTFCCITAGWRDVNIMAVPWLLPGYLSESLLPHSYWNGCGHYGCAVLDSPLLCHNYFVCLLCVEISPSCCRWFEWCGCAVTSLWICCVSEFLLPAALARDVNVIGCVLLDPFFIGLWCIWNSVASQLLQVV